MRQDFIDYDKLDINYLLGSAEQLSAAVTAAPKQPFEPDVVKLLDQVSRKLLSDEEARKYPDVVTFGFWIRKASVIKMKEQFLNDAHFRLGRGLVFHIAPSNVAVNFAYSMVASLLCGNANIVKAPSREFEQILLIVNAFRYVLKDYSELEPYITVIRYGHEKEINDALSALCDVRVIWGGDETIRQLKQSPIAPRATEIAFADRYSISYIEAEQYLKIPDKVKIASNFYNDTYLTDQNACTSPRIIFWSGSMEDISNAKKVFWDELHKIVERKYDFRDIWAIDKLDMFCLLAALKKGVERISSTDNLITRIKVQNPTAELMRWKCHAGFFFEYDCTDIMDLKNICSDLSCQTLSYLGEKPHLEKLLCDGIKGIDRIVPIGSTMDFRLIWDGYNLVERLTRIIDIR